MLRYTKQKQVEISLKMSGFSDSFNILGLSAAIIFGVMFMNAAVPSGYRSTKIKHKAWRTFNLGQPAWKLGWIPFHFLDGTTHLYMRACPSVGR